MSPKAGLSPVCCCVRIRNHFSTSDGFWLQDHGAAKHETRRRRQSTQGDHREGHLCHPAAASEALQTKPHLPGRVHRCNNHPFMLSFDSLTRTEGAQVFLLTEMSLFVS